jgi:hypothetical protein
MDRPGRVMIVGGALPGEVGPPTNSAEVIDLEAPTPQWSDLPPMAYARRQHTATLLPDGSTLVTGGTSARGFNNSRGAVLFAELWNPATLSWRTMAPAQEARLYHSTAVLLPDARVLVAGGGQPDGEHGDTDHHSAEVFSPPYLRTGQARPVIAAAPEDIEYGQPFTVTTASAAAVTDVTMVRLTSVTHGFNQNQRLNRLAYQTQAGGLLITPPSDPRSCPPGHYLLFILRQGVPSVGRIVRIGPAATVVTSNSTDK